MRRTLKEARERDTATERDMGCMIGKKLTRSDPMKREETPRQIGTKRDRDSRKGTVSDRHRVAREARFRGRGRHGERAKKQSQPSEWKRES